MSPALRNAFEPISGWKLGLSLSLYDDRLELHRFGFRVRCVLLADVEDVFVSASSEDPRNLRIRVRGGRAIEGHVKAVSLWKFALRERLGLEETAAAMPQSRAGSRTKAA